MKYSIRSHRLLVAGLIAATAALPVTQAAHAGPGAPDDAQDIAVPEGNKVFLVGHAVGVQIYSCDGIAWKFVAPNADLYGDNGKLVATHYGGPTWRATDGSTVVAKRVKDTTPDLTAIPWLSLETVSTAAGDGGDRFTNTTYIQRVATVGGLAPAAAECDAETAGDLREVPYSADYYFWKASAG